MNSHSYIYKDWVTTLENGIMVFNKWIIENIV